MRAQRAQKLVALYPVPSQLLFGSELAKIRERIQRSALMEGMGEREPWVDTIYAME